MLTKVEKDRIAVTIKRIPKETDNTLKNGMKYIILSKLNQSLLSGNESDTKFLLEQFKSHFPKTITRATLLSLDPEKIQKNLVDRIYNQISADPIYKEFIVSNYEATVTL